MQACIIQEYTLSHRKQAMPADATALTLSLDSLVANGLNVAGSAVARVTFTYADGREATIDLPRALEPSTLTPMQSAVAQAVNEMAKGEVLGYEEISERAGYSNSEGMRVFIRSLAEAGRLEKDHRGWKRR